MNRRYVSFRKEAQDTLGICEVTPSGVEGMIVEGMLVEGLIVEGMIRRSHGMPEAALIAGRS